MEAYSHTTIYSRPGEPTHIGVSFLLDTTAWIAAIGVGKDRCHLHIDHGDVTVNIGPIDATQLTATDVTVARRLADAAATYLAECDRLLAEQATQTPAA
jgi:hypothetical protein